MDTAVTLIRSVLPRATVGLVRRIVIESGILAMLGPSRTVSRKGADGMAHMSHVESGMLRIVRLSGAVSQHRNE